MLNTRMTDRPTSWRRAAKMPMTRVIGALMAMVPAMTTSICTCCTSLVIRVMSEGAPKGAHLSGREVGDLVEQGSRTSRPKLIATLAPR